MIQPRLLLFDEPLSNLDAKLRVQMRDEIRSVQKLLGITTVYVTHDQEEAMAISDRIAVMQAGRVAQHGTAETLYRYPASRFVAGFLGRTNLLECVVVAHAPQGVVLEAGGQRLTLRLADPPPLGSAVAAVIRPEAIGIGPPGLGLPATVTASVYLGDKVEYGVEWLGRTLQVVRSNPPEGERFLPGDPVSLTLPEQGVPLLLD